MKPLIVSFPHLFDYSLSGCSSSTRQEKSSECWGCVLTFFLILILFLSVSLSELIYSQCFSCTPYIVGCQGYNSSTSIPQTHACCTFHLCFHLFFHINSCISHGNLTHNVSKIKSSFLSPNSFISSIYHLMME